ncbi:E3 ubiquitin-protein ligase Jade-2 [Umbelopsis nana]
MAYTLFFHLTDCNLPVHQDCYGIDEVPSGSWYCERCADGVLPSETRIVCCPKLTGALKRTTAPTRYMHVVCAAWSKTIDSTEDPYNFNNQDLDKLTCYICGMKQGLCVQCEHTFCTKSFHITCALGDRLIKPSDTIPDYYQLLCATHAKEPDVDSSDELHSIRSKSRSSNTSHRRRSLQSRGRQVQSDDESKEDSDDSESSGRGNKSVASDASMDTEKSGSLTPQKLPAKKRKITPNNNTSNKKHGELELFKDDQSESDDDDDDDLGTRSGSGKKAANGGHRNSLPTATKSMSLQEMMRNKRKRADMEMKKGQQPVKTATTAGLSMDNTLTGSSSTLNKPAPPTVPAPQLSQPQQQQPTKNKLPKNGMGLATAASTGLGLGSGRPTTSSPGPTQSATSAVIKKPGAASSTNVPPIDFDTLQNDIRGGSHKWPINQATPALLSPVSNQFPFEGSSNSVTADRSNPGTPRFGDNKKLQTSVSSSRKGDSPALEYSELVGTMKGAMQEMMEGMLTKLQNSQISSNGTGPTGEHFNQLLHLQNQLRSAETEIFRLRELQRTELETCKRDFERNHRQFKSNVQSIFEMLGTKIPGMKASPDNIEDYVSEMKDIIASAKLDVRERDRVLQKVIAESQ